MAAAAVAVLALTYRWITAHPKASMAAGFCFLLGYYVSFLVLHGYWMFAIAPVLMGAYMPAFWVPYNILIMRVASRKWRGSIIGGYFLVFPAVSAIGPVIGGSIIESLGYNMLFILASVLLAGCIALLAVMKIDNPPRSASGTEVSGRRSMAAGLDFGRMSVSLRAALFSEGVQDGVFWIYPAVVGFELAKSELSLGMALSAFAFAGALMTVFLGFASDKIRNRKLFLIAGALLTAAFCAAASFTSGFGGFAAVMSITYFFMAIVPAFLFTVTTDEMEASMEDGTLIREFMLNGGRIVGAAICAAVALASGSLNYSIAVAGIALALVAVCSYYLKPGSAAGKKRLQNKKTSAASTAP
jgi:MFS family permease